MRLFSRLTFIFNVSFLLFVALRYIEIVSKKNRTGEGISPLPYITGILVILGQLAIFVNLVFCCTVLFLFITKKLQQIPQWLVVANLTLLFVQLYYFFIY